jgi:hypothetical protein
MKNKMGGACSAYGGEEGVHAEYRREDLVEDHSKNPGIDGRIILKCIFRKRVGSIDWIDLPQYRDRWRALVNKVMNLGAP